MNVLHKKSARIRLCKNKGLIMIQSAKLNKAVIFFDIEKHALGRAPTASNMLQYGSDNSLYFGLIGKSALEQPLKQILGVTDLRDVDKKSFSFDSYGNPIKILFNINAEGQIQLKMDGRTMFECFSDYMFYLSKKLDWNDYIIVLDFASKRLIFKPKRDLELA